MASGRISDNRGPPVSRGGFDRGPPNDDRGPPVRGGGFSFAAPGDAPVMPLDDLATLKNSMASITSSHEKMAQASQRIEEKLRADTEALEAAKTKFAETKAAVEGALNKCNKGRIKLNVGGVKYETTLTTLTADGDDSMLGSMFSGRHELHPDEDGEVFIDRDGKHFGHILNVLRDSSVTVPTKDRAAFQAELCYHGITAKRCQRLVKYVDAHGNETAHGGGRYHY
jgi:hypothetical protein